VDPEPPADGQEVVIRRGDLITLSINSSHKGSHTNASNKYAEIPVPTGEEQAGLEPHDNLPLEMELRDIMLPDGVFFGAFCNHRLDLSLSPERKACACLVRFHGPSSHIENQNEKIWFEFPVIGKGCEKYQKYECVVSCAFLDNRSTEWIHNAQDKIYPETTGPL